MGGDGETTDSNNLTYYIYNRGLDKCQLYEKLTTRLKCNDYSSKQINISDYSFQGLEKFITTIAEQYNQIFMTDSPTAKKMREDDKWKIVSKYEALSEDTKLSYTSFTITNTKTYEELVKLLSDSSSMVNIPEGTSFAFYRAYLIASGLTSFENKTQLQTYYCNDKWAGKRIDEIPALGLLRNLFNDRIESIAEMTPESQSEYADFLQRFANVGTIKLEGGDDKSMSSYKFLQVNSERCKSNKDSKGFVLFDDSSKIGETRDAYNQIAAELVNHIKKITDIIAEMIDLKAFTDAEPKLKIKPVFFTDKEGASKALEKIIKKARLALEEHYINVEMQYKRAILALEPTATFGPPPFQPQPQAGESGQIRQPSGPVITETIMKD